jgi:hypothetical protein
MAIRKRQSKKSSSGYTYEVNFTYKDPETGISKRIFKGGFKTKREAQEFEMMKRSELANPNFIKQSEKTLLDIYNEFMEIGSKEYQSNTIYNTQKTLRFWSGKKATIDLGAIPISKIKYKILQEFFNKREECGKAFNNDIKSALNRIFRYAVRCEYIASNPLEHVKVLGVENKKDKHILTAMEYQRLLSELSRKNTFEYDAIRIAVMIGYYTGLRISEAMAICRSDFDFEENTIFVHRKMVYKGLRKNNIYAVEKMKSKSSKAYLPLPEELKKELIKWFEINPYEKVVCDEDGNYLDPDCTGNKLRKIANSLGIQFHFHLLRDTYCTRLFENGLHPKIIQTLARHQSFNTTMNVYTHVNQNMQLDVVNKIFCGENVAKIEQ